MIKVKITATENTYSKHLIEGRRERRRGGGGGGKRGMERRAVRRKRGKEFAVSLWVWNGASR